MVRVVLGHHPLNRIRFTLAWLFVALLHPRRHLRDMSSSQRDLGFYGLFTVDFAMFGALKLWGVAIFFGSRLLVNLFRFMQEQKVVTCWMVFVLAGRVEKGLD